MSLRNTLAVFLALISLAASASAQSRAYRLNDRQARELLERIGNNSETFRLSLNAALDRSRFDGARRENEINRFVVDFTEATNRLTNRFNNRQAVENDVRETLNRAAFIDGFMRRERLDARAQRDWSSLRADLDQLARAWNVNWRWDNQSQYPSGPGYGYSNNRLTGTWQLNAGRSDNARTAAERATRGLGLNDRQRVQENLIRRLEAPTMLAIDRRGQTVAMASSHAQQVTFEANGREVSETLPMAASAAHSPR